MRHRVVGHKIGLTSKPMQEMLGVDQPDYGVLYDDRVHTTGVQLDVAALIAPRVEPELAFILREDLPGPGVTTADVRAATGAIVPALEVIDSRIRDWKITLIDTIADNASCHCAVLATERHPVSDIDLPAAAVTMTVDGEPLQQGVGAAVLGDPAEAVAWLANALARHGVALKTGHVVLSGSITTARSDRRGQPRGRRLRRTRPGGGDCAMSLTNSTMGEHQMRQLTSLDAQFLAVEDGNTHGHVSSLGIFDPSGAPR